MTDNEDAHPDAFEPERKPVVYMHTYNGADKFLKACGYGITGKAAWKKISLRHMVDIPEGTCISSDRIGVSLVFRDMAIPLFCWYLM